MISIPMICKTLAIVSSIFVCVSCSSIKTSEGDFTGAVSISEGSSTMHLTKDDVIVAEIDTWIRTAEPKWERSLKTYAPMTILRNEHYNLNFTHDLAVLNFKPDPTKSQWIQVERHYQMIDIPALENLRTKLEKPNKTLHPTADQL